MLSDGGVLETASAELGARRHSLTHEEEIKQKSMHNTAAITLHHIGL